MTKYKADSLYIHIPFCKSLCSYCDFAKVIYNQKRVDDYFKLLFFELKSLKINKLSTIYIGGGTPSSIDNNNLNKLLSYLSKHLKKEYEFSIECNVEDINISFLKLIKKYKVNRLSVGIQTFNDKYIKLCNRHHTKEMAINNVKLASSYIDNISIDMIYAIVNQTLEELKEDVKIATSLPIKHISYYSLLIEDNTLLKRKNYQNMDDNIQASFYEYIYNYLKEKGFKRYEISNFSKPHYQSKHNKVYWQNKHYYGVGLNASGYLGNVRYTNNDNLNYYSKKDYTKKETITLSKDDIMFEQIMLNLRLDKGLNISYFNKKFNTDFYKKYQPIIKKLSKEGLIISTPKTLKTTFKGSLLLNDVLEEFIL